MSDLLDLFDNEGDFLDGEMPSGDAHPDNGDGPYHYSQGMAEAWCSGYNHARARVARLAAGAVAVPADRPAQITDEMVERAAQALADDRNGFTVPPAVVHDGYRATARLALRAALGEPEDER